MKLLSQNPPSGQVGLTVFFKDDYFFKYKAPLNQWLHLTFTAETNRTILYVNAVKNSELPVSFPLPLLQIGRRTPEAPGADWLHADLDEIAVYRRALSSDDVTRIFANGGTNSLPSRISAINYRSGLITLDVTGTPKTRVLLETSSDLLRWETPVWLSNESGTLTVTDFSAGNRTFYRITDEP